METITIYSENHMKHIHELCGQYADFLNFKAGGTYIDYASQA
jgi:hypothetical protein